VDPQDLGVYVTKYSRVILAEARTTQSVSLFHFVPNKEGENEKEYSSRTQTEPPHAVHGNRRDNMANHKRVKEGENKVNDTFVRRQEGKAIPARNCFHSVHIRTSNQAFLTS